MSVLKSSDFLSTLIKTGPDASLNLYTISFLRNGSSVYNSLLSLRTTNIESLVTRDITTATLPYQNVDIQVVSSGTSITKTQTFSIRVDKDYRVLETLRNYQCIDENGDFYRDENKKIDITIDALSPSDDMYSQGEYKSVYRWKFNDCYVTNIVPLSYSYESPATASVNVTFVWSTYLERSISGEDSVEYITSSDVKDIFFNQSKSMWYSLFDKEDNK